MESIALWLPTAFVLLFWWGPLLDSRLAHGPLVRLGDQPDSPPPGGWPTLSVVVPACNEAATLEPAMRSLLAQDYPDLEIVAVNDRSTDGTGPLLDRLAEGNPRLSVLHLTALPGGWLGKTHALHIGAAAARGRYVLFTDADVHLAPGALRRAVALMEARSLDHLVTAGEIELRGGLERATVGFFTYLFVANFRPWHASHPNPRFYAGVGAFNMVRAEAYRQRGGHGPLAMEVVDDVMLGRMMKEAGGRSLFVDGHGQLRVRWVHGIRDMFSSLEKNAFAGVDYRLWLALLGVAAVLTAGWWPWIGLWLGTAGVRIGCLAALAGMVTAAHVFRPAPDSGARDGLFYPLGASLVAAIILYSTWCTLRRGGVVWRGTFYPLAALRRTRRR